jgi:hypothetical protein
VLKAWIDSASHKENLLNPEYQEIGVAVKEGKFENENSIVVVQIFGDPTVVSTVKGVMDSNMVSSVAVAGSTMKNNFSNSLAEDTASNIWPFAVAFVITLILYQANRIYFDYLNYARCIYCLIIS